MGEYLDNLPDNLFGSIPEILHSTYEKQPFTECISCNRNLDEYGGVYEIQKIYRHSRAIWEHAICSDCGDDLLEDYSDESRQNIRAFMRQVDMFREEMDVCHKCDSEVRTGQEHMIAGICRGEKMMISPLVMCLECLNRMNEQLSTETRDSWDDFMEENVPGLPAAEEPVSDVPISGI